MNPIDKLTEKELKDIEYYIDCYATGCRRVPVTELLQPWNAAKGRLFEMFNNELIFKKRVNYKIDICQIRDNICKSLFYNGSPYKKFTNHLMETYVEFLESIGKADRSKGWWDTVDKSYMVLSDTLGAYNLSKNEVDFSYVNSAESTIIFYLPDGKEYKCQRGTKAIKLIGKLAEAFNIEGFKDFRLVHSQCLNQKELTGELCLSIHPMDYMTMSDNNCGWSSCMNWRHNGEYRQGTVEMMNSPIVIVGYLASDEPFDWECGHEWNNKKWRCLFVVNNNYILTVKAYPYHNAYLLREAIKTIAAQMGWGEIEPHSFEPEAEQNIDGHRINIQPTTGAMYNDFGSAIEHFIGLNPSLEGDIVDQIRFSGVSECMTCGAVFDYWENSESSLSCDDCDPGCHCEECGNRMYDGEGYWVGDTLLCEECVNEFCFWDNIDCTYHWNEVDEPITIRLSSDLSPEKRFLDHPKYPWCTREITIAREKLLGQIFHYSF